VRRGDVLATVETAEEAKVVATAFLQLYRENASFKERTYDFVPRMGLEEIRRRVTDEESRALLLERFRLAKTAAAAADPWLERRRPYHPRQFTDLGEVQLPMAGAAR
jgi:nitrite reductase (NADH) large subunit